MRPVGCLVLVALTAVPAAVAAQETSAAIESPPQPTVPPSSVEPQPVAFDLGGVSKADAPIAPDAPISRLCPTYATLPGDDPGIVVCARRERSYARISKDYDKGGWAEPPLPPADPTTLKTGSCLDITCLPPPTINAFSLLGGLYKIGKKIVEGE